MSRYERFSEEKELNKNFPLAGKGVSGLPVYYDKKRQLHCDPGPAHALITATTGYGKTYGVSLSAIMRCIEATESFVVIDSKKDALRHTFNAVPENYQKFVFDFSKPAESPDKWNPLELIRVQLTSSDITEQDLGYENLNAFTAGLPDKDKDSFWPNSSTELLTGTAEALIESSNDPREVHMGSICRILRDGNERFGGNIVLKSFYDSLSDDSLAKQHLGTFVNAPNDTRNSIYAVTSTALSVFTRSRGLLQMISQDTIDIAHLDNSESPVAIYICLPDENNVHAKLAGCLIQQLSQQFIKLARSQPDGKLKNRISFILEELGSIGGSIPNLANLMTAGRSRGIRMVLILQSLSQLDAIYGESAEAIKNCIGITYSFSNNNLDTLKEFSEKCGYCNDKDLLITPAQLSAMPPLQCLVILYNRYKFISKFEFFTDVYKVEEYTPSGQEREKIEKAVNSIKYFNIKEYVKKARERAQVEAIRKNNELNPFAQPHSLPSSCPSDPLMSDDIDIDELVKKIDEEIAKREREIESERNDE